MPEVMLFHLKEEFEILLVEAIFMTMRRTERWNVIADRIKAHTITADILVVFSLYSSTTFWADQAFIHNLQILLSSSLL